MKIDRLKINYIIFPEHSFPDHLYGMLFSELVRTKVPRC